MIRFVSIWLGADWLPQFTIISDMRELELNSIFRVKTFQKKKNQKYIVLFLTY